jgi:hypothetical protein
VLQLLMYVDWSSKLQNCLAQQWNWWLIYTRSEKRSSQWVMKLDLSLRRKKKSSSAAMNMIHPFSPPHPTAPHPIPPPPQLFQDSRVADLMRTRSSKLAAAITATASCIDQSVNAQSRGDRSAAAPAIGSKL